MFKSSKIFVAGHGGLVGSSICRKLETEGYTNLVLRTHDELDLQDQLNVEIFFQENEIEFVFDASARVGGIHANDTYSAEFIYQNSAIQNNLIHFSWKYGVKKFLFLGSVCIYPKHAQTPVVEESLLTGALEPTNEAYALAKIHGLYMLRAYRKQYEFKCVSLMPANLYGPNDRFHPENSHVIPGLIYKFHNAKHQGDNAVTCWGDGTPMREFLYVDDLAEACIFAMGHYENAELINVGSGADVTIRNLATMIAEVVGYEGVINWDTSKPNGTPKRPLDYTKIEEKGWRPKTGLQEGLIETYRWFCENEYRM